MTFPIIIDDYQTTPDATLIADMLEGLSLTKNAHFKDKQYHLLLLLNKTNQAKTIPNAHRLVQALLTYVLELNRIEHEEVPVICTEGFMEQFESGKQPLGKLLEERLTRLDRRGHSSLEDKKKEWQNLCKVVGTLLEALFDAPAKEFCQLLEAYRQQQSLTREEFSFCFLRLAEILLAITKKPSTEETLQNKRIAFLDQYRQIASSSLECLYLYRAHLVEEYGAVVANSDWECRITEDEQKLFAHLITAKDVAQEHVVSTIERCRTKGAQELAERILSHTVPLQAVLEGHNVDDYISYLDRVLTGKSKVAFSSFSDEAKQAVVLLLFATTCQEDEKSASLLLCAIPYCINNLRNVTSGRLTASLTGSEEDIKGAIHRQIGKFLLSRPKVSDEQDAWPSVNQLLRHIAANQMQEPMLLLTRALVSWKRDASPTPKQAALAIRCFAQFAEGFTEVGDSVHDITHHLLLSLVTSSIEKKGLFLVNVLFHLEKMEGKELTPTGPSWTETLDDDELSLFSSLLTGSDIDAKIYKELFSHYTREGATDKSLALAVHITPALEIRQIKQLISRLNEPLTALFIQVVTSTTFPPKKYPQIVASLFHAKTVKSLLLAVRLMPSLYLHDLVNVIAQLDELTPASCAPTEEHRAIVRSLNQAVWHIAKEFVIHTTLDERAHKLLQSLHALTAKLLLENEFSPTHWEQKLQEAINLAIRLGKKSPTMLPLLPTVLRRSVSPVQKSERPNSPEEIIN